MAEVHDAADPYGRGNYVEGSANLEARASLWSYRDRGHGEAPGQMDWFCDLVEWDGVEVTADVGCGSGRFLASLARRAERVIGLDLSLAMLREIRARSSELLVGADVCRLPLRDDCLDMAVAAWMLYHAADPDMACAELRRVLRPSAALIAVTNAAAHTAELDEIFAEATTALFGEERLSPRLPANGFTLDEAAAHLSRHFPSGTIHVRRVPLKVPTPEPIVAYLASLRSYIDEALASGGSSFDDLAPHIAEVALRHIAATGGVEVTGLSAAIVCR
jgi:SAM-dependent methyltransferase